MRKSEYKSRRDALAELYKNVKNADIDAELTADLVGDYLFTDADFVNNLSANHRNVFQKIYDEVKYLCKIATAGSKEARQLEKVKKTFEDAFRAETKNTAQEGGVKHSLTTTTDGRTVAVVDSDILSNIDTTSWDSTKKEAAKKAASDALTKYSGGIVVDGITRKVNRTSRREYTRSNDTERLYKKSPDVFADKMRAADIADDIVVATTNWSRDGGLVHSRKDNFVDFDHGVTLIMSGNSKYQAEVVVGITSKGEAVFYDVVDMTPTAFDIKTAESSTTATTQDAIGDIQEDSADNSIPQNSKKSTENANESFSNAEVTRYSLTKDIDNFDNSWYNELELPAAEQERVQSEALTWHAGKRNQLITQTLSNGITYRYVIDDDGIVHIYGKKTLDNIYDLGEDYGNTNRTQLDSIAEEHWSGQRDNSSDSRFSRDGREPRKDDTNDNYVVSREGRSNGTGYSKDRTNAYGKPKKRHWHFNEDGSTEITYSDGTKELQDIAPVKKASSEDGVFFGGKTRHSLSDVDSDLGPIGDYNVYGNDVAIEGPLPDDFAPIAETANSQTSVDSDEVLDNEAEWTYNIPEPKYETHRSFAEMVVDNISAEEIENGVNKAIREYAISDDESFALRAYVAGAAYDMTRAQRSGDRSEQSEYEAYLENQVRAGLLKHPTYTGFTYRNLDFDTVFNSDEDYNAFLKEHTVGKIIDLNAFTSASKEPNGYPTIGKKAVHLVIYGQSARDISETYNGQQQEVIYLPGTKYRVVRVTTANDGNPLIYGKEITDNEVQQLQGNTSSTEPINGIEGIPQGQEYDNDRVSNVGRVYERTEGTDQLSKTVQIHGNRRSETQAERNEIAPLGKASSEDGVFFDGKTRHSLSDVDSDLGPIGDYNVYGKDVALEGPLPDDFAPVAEMPNSQTSVDSENGNVNRVDTSSKEYISFEDFANTDSSVWRNVEYDDTATKSAIMQEVHDAMVKDGAVIQVSENVTSRVEESFPDLRGMKKKERTPILKEAINKLKTNLRQFLNGFKNQTFEFEVDGKVLEAKLYNTGINEVLEKITQDKASMLYTTEEIFGNARYLYSTPDYDGDPNVYRWNYFYTPVQIGSETVGVRIAVRDTANPAESHIYNWNIKKDASLDGEGRGKNSRISHGVSSEASNDIIAPEPDSVNTLAKTTEDGVSDDLGPIAQEPAVQEPTETESDAKTDNSNLSVRELYQQKLSNHKNALNALETDKSNSLSSFDEAIRKKLVEYNGLKDKLEARLGNFNTELNNVRLRLIGNIIYDYVLFGNSVLAVS